MNIRDSILRQIDRERDRQNELWGGVQQFSMPEFVSIIAEELGEAATEANKLHWGHKAPTAAIFDLETELVQTAACCVQALERLQQIREVSNEVS